MPPQQAENLLDFINDGLDFGAHVETLAALDSRRCLFAAANGGKALLPLALDHGRGGTALGQEPIGDAVALCDRPQVGARPEEVIGFTDNDPRWAPAEPERSAVAGGIATASATSSGGDVVTGRTRTAFLPRWFDTTRITAHRRSFALSVRPASASRFHR
jgi:hypothetical protein